MPKSRLMKAQTYPLVRIDTQGYVDSNGDWVEGTDDTVPQETVQGNLQPIVGRDMKLLPEGFKATDVRVFYTQTKLKTVDDVGKTWADYILVDGRRYQAQTVEPWYGIYNSHYKIIMVREEA